MSEYFVIGLLLVMWLTLDIVICETACNTDEVRGDAGSFIVLVALFGVIELIRAFFFLSAIDAYNVGNHIPQLIVSVICAVTTFPVAYFTIKKYI